MTKPKTFTDDQIPAHWKAPYGPYRQAPPMYGGEWWFVNPFTSAEPWKRFAHQPTPVTLPDGFMDIFGEEPQFKDFPDSRAWTTARNHWDQNLKQFKGAGRPLWLSVEQVAELDALYTSWAMGKPRFYGGRYGEMVRWPDSQVQDFEDSAYSAANFPHHTIARYQIDLAQNGVQVETGKRHPFVPPGVWPAEDAGE
jgi:hypothetical protein